MKTRATVRGGIGKGQKKVVYACTVNKPAKELFKEWRKFENLPRFMHHLVSVTQTSEKDSHWVAKAPLGQTVEWDAEIINETQNELIAWRTKKGAAINHAGTIRFSPAPISLGTEIKVALEYETPGGKAGALLAKILGEEPDIQVAEDLRRFKALMETGEIPTTQGQPVGAAQKKKK